FHVHVCVRKTIYGQASRLISIGKLNASLRLHTRPITWSSSRSLQRPYGLGNLILWRVSRLDAFSVSPFRTYLPSAAVGTTPRTLEVRPSRSSRTKDSPTQISSAHDR